MTAGQVEAFGTIIAAVAAFAAIAVAQDQLKNLVESSRMNGLMAVLQLEAEMNSRADRLDQINLDIRKKLIAAEPDLALIEILNDRRAALLESYLNAVDRLAFCILKGYITTKDWRKEYEVFFPRIIAMNPGYFAEGTAYDNIMAVAQEWQRLSEAEKQRDQIPY